MIIEKEEYKRRLKICFDCPAYQKSLNRCKNCGCFLILKAALKASECPLEKWKNNVK